ncbi:alcohol dehydrogenase catalytic domain-containing protein [Paenibacillus filicis]|uniref:Alcohol dehydrogenase catalytic domain-containing protein n=1 Tax=Paenibacillus gyeongsangnamensis TaxID=3388067 RepID=A0ABT4Q8R2_9BACL|nr:alcohol dehydrogenase catalytic domain-containing protein [Paenibacillus filicis]MCZ8513258.1 alcohol dehydrogenase catalytic domain-containing protein [Paenibacillus filicis]
MKNMRIVVNGYGGADVLEAVREPLPAPGPGEVRVKVESAGVALADIMRREGVYPGSPIPPFTPGYDAVGIVDAVGENVTRFVPGDMAAVLFNGVGGYSAYVCAREEELIRVPDRVDSAEAAAALLNYVTAYQMLHRFAKLGRASAFLSTAQAEG